MSKQRKSADLSINEGIQADKIIGSAIASGRGSTASATENITNSQVGAIGPNAQAYHVSFTQLWSGASGELDLQALATELATLRIALKDRAVEPEHDMVVGEVAAAER